MSEQYGLQQPFVNHNNNNSDMSSEDKRDSNISSEYQGKRHLDFSDSNEGLRLTYQRSSNTSENLRPFNLNIGNTLSYNQNSKIESLEQLLNSSETSQDQINPLALGLRNTSFGQVSRKSRVTNNVFEY